MPSIQPFQYKPKSNIIDDHYRKQTRKKYDQNKGDLRGKRVGVKS